jgi:hypothetical protein
MSMVVSGRRLVAGTSIAHSCERCYLYFSHHRRLPMVATAKIALARVLFDVSRAANITPAKRRGD